jgi:GT2 family glycosyltransferase
MKLLIVIVCYRAVDLTIECLRSLSTEIRSVPDAKVAVCENGTGGDSAQRLADAIEREGWSDWVSLHVIDSNRGFPGGNNVVLREAMSWTSPPDYFLLLNSDTIVHPHALRLLVDAVEKHPDVGIVGPRLEAADGSAQVSCFRFFSPLSEFLRAARTGPLTRLLQRYDVPLAPCDHPIEPDWICFACAMIRREVMEKIGLLDEGYYLYFDDPDYCRRARRAGWRVLYCPEARVTHLIGQSDPTESLAAQLRRRPRYFYASRTRYFVKFYGVVGLLLANVLWTAGRAVALIREVAGNKPRHICDCEWRDIWTQLHRPMLDWDRTPLTRD